MLLSLPMSVALVYLTQKRMVGSLMLGVQLADVSTRCSGHPQGALFWHCADKLVAIQSVSHVSGGPPNS